MRDYFKCDLNERNTVHTHKRSNTILVEWIGLYFTILTPIHYFARCQAMLLRIRIRFCCWCVRSHFSEWGISLRFYYFNFDMETVHISRDSIIRRKWIKNKNELVLNVSSRKSFHNVEICRWVSAEKDIYAPLVIKTTIHLVFSHHRFAPKSVAK